jgi:hypothetical protein
MGSREVLDDVSAGAWHLAPSWLGRDGHYATPREDRAVTAWQRGEIAPYTVIGDGLQKFKSGYHTETSAASLRSNFKRARSPALRW